MPMKPASPLIARMLRNFLRGCAATFVLVTLVTLIVDYQERFSLAQKRLENIIEFARAPIAHALWNFDLPQLQTEIASLVLEDVIYKVEVYDERHQRLASADKLGAAVPIEAVLESPIVDIASQKNIGTMRLHISNAPIRKQFWLGARWSVVGEFIEIAVLAALLFYLLHRNIIRHLLTVVEQINTLNPQQPQRSLLLPRAPHEADEIDQLIDAINRFHREIVAERNARHQVELQTRNLSNELARMGRVATVQSLATTIAHELNQPLGAILSNAEAIELSMPESLAADAPLREVLADIVGEARRAGKIIRNMRDLTEKRDIETSVLELNPLVQQVAELVQMDARWDSIHIDYQLAESLPPVLGNAVQLQQVIINLVANARDAIRHAPAGEGLITITTQQLDERWVGVVVCDNGPGIAPDKIGSILKPFFTTKEGGTGMGLWISQMLVEQHGGKLEFANKPGGGARFSFTLPVAQS